jgi:hypothetical protein
MASSIAMAVAPAYHLSAAVRTRSEGATTVPRQLQQSTRDKENIDPSGSLPEKMHLINIRAIYECFIGSCKSEKD